MKTFTMCATLMALLIGSPAVARDPDGVVHHESAPSSLNADKAYIHFDSSRAKSGMMKITHVFMRIPEQTEIDEFLAAKRAAYEKELPKLRRKAKGGEVPSFEQFPFEWDKAENVFAVDMGASIDKTDSFLIEVPEGTYVLYGIAVGSRALTTCNCLGTVKFDARAGVVTQLGSLFADKSHKASDVPHIEDGLGEKMFQYGFVLSQALVPATEASSIPQSMAHLPARIASFEPVPMFREPRAQAVNRLAPIPGVLEYDRGQVIVARDRASGETAN